MAKFLSHLGVLQFKDYVTLANAACGLLAILLVFARDAWAPALVVLGVVFDALDGMVSRKARKGKAASANAFGVELDSLADGLTFGLAPVVLLLGPSILSGTHLVDQFFALALLSGVFYLCCILTRLALFNLQKDKGYFEGMPSPLAAVLALTWNLLVPAWGWVGLLVFGALAASSYRFSKPKVG